MKRMIAFLSATVLCLTLMGCGKPAVQAQIAATTLPVYEFTQHLCRNTDLKVTQLITENISCLHDYTVQLHQMQTIETAQLLVISGVGLESFLSDVLSAAPTIIDASNGVALLCPQHHSGHEHSAAHSHLHEEDPHIWLSPANGKVMAQNIFNGLCKMYPEHTETFSENLRDLNRQFDALQAYADTQLRVLDCRDIITFHDGFSYMADAFNLHILKAIEEESGSEASAAELIELCTLVEGHRLPAVFTEKNGSSSAASVISAQTGTAIFQLDMAVSGGSYFMAMYNNIDTLKEALG